VEEPIRKLKQYFVGINKPSALELLNKAEKKANNDIRYFLQLNQVLSNNITHSITDVFSSFLNDEACIGGVHENSVNTIEQALSELGGMSVLEAINAYQERYKQTYT